MKPAKIPKYYQIKVDILDAIKSGNLKPGDVVDSESVLKAKYKVSAITVRKAFNDLINEGYLVGVQGKGTFVAKKGFNRALTSLSLSDELSEQGYKTDLVLDEVCKIQGEYYAKQLGIDENEPITKVSRIRLGEGEVIAYQTSYVASKLLNPEQAKKTEETKSFYKALEMVDVIPSWAMETYSVKEVKSSHIAKLMRIPKNQCAFFVKRITYDREDSIVEYAESYFNKDRHSISVMIKR